MLAWINAKGGRRQISANLALYQFMFKEFSEETKLAVWKKAKIVEGWDPAKRRKDRCEAWIRWAEYGNRKSTFGWEIDHIDPNGSDNLVNLQPLQWENNVAKSDNGRLKCVVTAREN